MVFRNGERLLWNPLKRQALKIRPEERVRLQILEYLMLQSMVPASRIAVESPVPSRFSRGRTDLLCYDGQFAPWLLIECKAENVRLGPRAATQSAVYNRFVKAPNLMLTNGLEDALFQVAGKLKPVDPSGYPGELLPLEPDWHSDDPEYWSARGFFQAKLPDTSARPIARRLAQLYHLAGETRSWLEIPTPIHPHPPPHYHLLLSAENQPDTLIAVSLRATAPDQAVFTAVANRKKTNFAFFLCSLGTDGYFGEPKIVQHRTGKDYRSDKDRRSGNDRHRAGRASSHTAGESRDHSTSRNPDQRAGHSTGSSGPIHPAIPESHHIDKLNEFWFRVDGDSGTQTTPEQSALAARELSGILERILTGT